MIVVLVFVQIVMGALVGFALSGGVLLAIPAFIALCVTLCSAVRLILSTRQPRAAVRLGERAELQGSVAHPA